MEVAVKSPVAEAVRVVTQRINPEMLIQTVMSHITDVAAELKLTAEETRQVTYEVLA